MRFCRYILLSVLLLAGTACLFFVAADARASESGVPLSLWEGTWDNPNTSENVRWLSLDFPVNPPNRDGRNLVWFRTRLPAELPQSPVLVISYFDQNGEVFVAGREVANVGPSADSGVIKFVGYFPVIVSLDRVADAGAEVLIRVRSQHVNIGLGRAAIYVGAGEFMRQAYFKSLPEIAMCGLTALIALVSLGVFFARRRWLETLFFGLHGLFALLFFASRFPIWTLWINDAMLAQSLELLGFMGLVTMFVGFVARLFVSERLWLLNWLFRLSAAVAVVLFVVLLNGMMELPNILALWQIWTLVVVAGVSLSLVILIRFGASDARILGFCLVLTMLSGGLDTAVSLGWISIGFVGYLPFVYLGFMTLVGGNAAVLFLRARRVYFDMESRGHELEALTVEGRRIASAADLPTLVKRLPEGAAAIAGFASEITVFFAASVFVGKTLEQSFYLVDERGDPLEETPVFDTSSEKNGCETIFVNDPRSGENLAAIRVEERGARTVRLLLTNIANAIANARFRKAYRVLEIRTEEQRTILSHMDQGILLLDEQGRVLPEASKYCRTLFGKDPTGCDFATKILEFVMPDSSERQVVGEHILSLFHKPIPNSLLAQRALPKELQTQTDGETCFIELDWIPVLGLHGLVERVMVVMRDVSRLRVLRELAEQKEIESQLTEELLEMDPERGELTLKACDWLSVLLRDVGCQQKMVPASWTNTIPRRLDELNAMASRFGLTRLALEIQALRQTIQEDGGNGIREEKITVVLSRVEKVLVRYEELARRYELFQDASDLRRLLVAATAVVDSTECLSQLACRNFCRELVGFFEPTLRNLVVQLAAGLHSTAAEAGREPPKVVVEGADDWVFNRVSIDLVQSVLVHLARNSLVHGFRSGFCGTIHIQPRREQDDWLLNYWDDGVGLDLDALKLLGHSRGEIGSDKPSDDEVAQIIFSDGASTAEETGRLAGRGFGMSAVRHMLLGIGGDICIRLAGKSTIPGRRCFVISMRFPMDVIYARI